MISALRLSLLPSFSIPKRETRRLTFLADAFDMFNHPQFNNPVCTVGTRKVESVAPPSPTGRFGWLYRWAGYSSQLCPGGHRGGSGRTSVARRGDIMEETQCIRSRTGHCSESFSLAC